jgi:transcriptional regulator MraZ
MANFRASFLNRIDQKGRISVPASFRATLGEDNKALFCMPSLIFPAIDAYTQERLDAMSERYERENDPGSVAYGQHHMIMDGDVWQIAIDGDGRIIIPEPLRSYAGITDQATFVGAGPHFQIWEPATHQKEREKARRAMRARMGVVEDPEGPGFR